MSDELEQADACWDCEVTIGQPCLDDCDVAPCLVTGLQRFSCMEDHDHGQYVFTGWRPMARECREFGWLIDVPTVGPMGDYNRFGLAIVRGEVQWDRAAQRWVKEATKRGML